MNHREGIGTVQSVDQLDDDAVLTTLLASQRRAIDAVDRARGPLSRAARDITDRLRLGGRLVYIGAGSSGLIAVQDGAELPGTFGLSRAKVVFLFAGGCDAVFDLVGDAEDDESAAVRGVSGLGDLRRDVAIAVSASGSTPYTLAAARAAVSAGACLVGIANQPGAPLLQLSHHPILLDSGREAIDGSTRLAAGTAQKCALGMLSTLCHIRLGHVHDGMMVNVRPDNAKLRRRATDIVACLGNVDHDRAGQALDAAGGSVKAAVLICAGAQDRRVADELVEAAGGNLKIALDTLRTRSFQCRQRNFRMAKGPGRGDER